eukprot:TRINITY_DN30478_c0_g1_i1.p1 TRINITY_DN30478_c0_g1~~TRINITY_DN30478_c0_g1_i1.p1  ORF type:complete len:403 (+),score=17.14 TRINITY_DN30478_c0_g1_i1:17-1225(+)
MFDYLWKISSFPYFERAHKYNVQPTATQLGKDLMSPNVDVRIAALKALREGAHFSEYHGVLRRKFVRICSIGLFSGSAQETYCVTNLIAAMARTEAVRGVFMKYVETVKELVRLKNDPLLQRSGMMGLAWAYGDDSLKDVREFLMRTSDVNTHVYNTFTMCPDFITRRFAVTTLKLVGPEYRDLIDVKTATVLLHLGSSFEQFFYSTGLALVYSTGRFLHHYATTLAEHTKVGRRQAQLPVLVFEKPPAQLTKWQTLEYMYARGGTLSFRDQYGMQPITLQRAVAQRFIPALLCGLFFTLTHDGVYWFHERRKMAWQEKRDAMTLALLRRNKVDANGKVNLPANYTDPGKYCRQLLYQEWAVQGLALGLVAYMTKQPSKRPFLFAPFVMSQLVYMWHPNPWG